MICGGEFSVEWLNYVNRKITSQEMQDWVMTGSRADKRWRMRKIALWTCWSARRGAYSSWYEAFGIRPWQMNTLSLARMPGFSSMKIWSLCVTKTNPKVKSFSTETHQQVWLR